MPKAHTNPFSMLYQNLQQQKALACSPAHDAHNSCLPLGNLLKEILSAERYPRKVAKYFLLYYDFKLCGP